MPPIIGIDLGTTNSLVAYVDYRTGLPRVRVEATERHAPAAASIICKPTHGPHEAEITRILASVRPGGGIECS